MNTIEKKSVQAASYLSKQQVDTFTGTYKQERWADNSERMERADSLSVWFSVEELENYLAQVKDHGGNAVRLHFGVIPQGFAENPAVEGLQTVVFIANRSKDNSPNTSRVLLTGNQDKLALTSVLICPPMCGYPPTPTGTGTTMLLDRGEKGMSVI